MRVMHVPGAVNTCADAISRNLMHVFFKENPFARKSPILIPDCLWDILARTQPDWRSESSKRSLVTSLELASQIVREESIQWNLQITDKLEHNYTDVRRLSFIGGFLPKNIYFTFLSAHILYFTFL